MNLSCQLHGRFRFAFGEEHAHVFLLRNWHACPRTVNGRTGKSGLVLVFHTHSGATLISFLKATKLTNLATNDNSGPSRHCELLWRTINDRKDRKSKRLNSSQL